MKTSLTIRSVLSAGVFAGLFVAGSAHANTVTGSVYEVTSAQAQSATPATIASLTSGPVVTFSTDTPLNFMSDNEYTIGQFLTSNTGTVILTGSGHYTDTMNNTLVNITGSVTVTNGETFTAGHDDGVTLMIDGTTVIDAPGPSQYNLTTSTYTGPSGTFNFQLVYGECCDGPADLSVDLPLTTTSVTPEPSSLLLLSTGLLGAGGVLRRKIVSRG